ncbi:MAG TPA: GNAT family N-acetyltransferase [Ktedonobacterales bacterium]|nr:GNAT family N-acetyltransferase [Ktedonobacterales bacterium]
MAQTQQGITAIEAEDLPRVVEVWEASVRATHGFLTEADIQFFKSLVGDDLMQLAVPACVRDGDGQVGFVGMEGVKVEAVFVHPAWRGQGIGPQLLSYAVETLGATELDVNEQNDQAVGSSAAWSSRSLVGPRWTLWASPSRYCICGRAGRRRRHHKCAREA